MKCLLLTTVPNAVSDALCSAALPEKADIIDWAEFSDKKSFLYEVQKTATRDTYDLLITYRCPYIIPSRIREYFGRCINIHPVALPEFAGINPWEKVKAANIMESEVTVHIMTDEADKGDILCTKSYSFESFDAARNIADSTAAHLILEWIKKHVPNDFHCM